MTVDDLFHTMIDLIREGRDEDAYVLWEREGVPIVPSMSWDQRRRANDILEVVSPYVIAEHSSRVVVSRSIA